MWQELLAAFGLVLVIEGILPFLSPGRFREAMLTAANLDSRSLRSVGLISMIAGLVIIYLVRG